MTQFRTRPGTRSAVHQLKIPFPDIAAFDRVVRSLTLGNPLGCTSYMSSKRRHPPIEVVREMYTAKFAYSGTDGRRKGSTSEVYDSVEGYELGVAAVVSHMANIAAHRGRVKHLKESDRFSVLLKCHDPRGELYFLSIGRNRITLASYSSEDIQRNVSSWADTIP